MHKDVVGSRANVSVPLAADLLPFTRSEDTWSACAESFVSRDDLYQPWACVHDCKLLGRDLLAALCNLLCRLRVVGISCVPIFQQFLGGPAIHSRNDPDTTLFHSPKKSPFCRSRLHFTKFTATWTQDSISVTSVTPDLVRATQASPMFPRVTRMTSDPGALISPTTLLTLDL